MSKVMTHVHYYKLVDVNIIMCLECISFYNVIRNLNNSIFFFSTTNRDSLEYRGLNILCALAESHYRQLLQVGGFLDFLQSLPTNTTG